MATTAANKSRSEKMKAWHAAKKIVVEPEVIEPKKMTFYNTIYIKNESTRQKSHRLIWSVNGEKKSFDIREKRKALSAFRAAIKVLKSIGYTENKLVKEELTKIGWYFVI